MRLTDQPTRKGILRIRDLFCEYGDQFGVYYIMVSNPKVVLPIKATDGFVNRTSSICRRPCTGEIKVIDAVATRMDLNDNSGIGEVDRRKLRTFSEEWRVHGGPWNGRKKAGDARKAANEANLELAINCLPTMI